MRCSRLKAVGRSVSLMLPVESTSWGVVLPGPPHAVSAESRLLRQRPEGIGRAGDREFYGRSFTTLEKVYAQSVSQGQFGSFIYNMITTGRIPTQINETSFAKLINKVLVGLGIILDLNEKMSFFLLVVFEKPDVSDVKNDGVLQR